MLDVAAISSSQFHLLSRVADAFASVSGWAMNLLYVFAVLEIVIFGLLWAFTAEANWGRLVFKVLKIGLIFFVIQGFAHLLSLFVDSFADIAGVTANTSGLGDVIFNPALLWQYGYNSSLALLQSGALAKNSMGLTLIQVSLGLGSLFCFALLAIQIIFQLVAFYLTGLFALLFMPLSVFSAGGDFFEQGLTSILQAGVRLAVLIVIIGLAVSTWQFFDLEKTTLPVSINQALGLFNSALLFAFLALRLPALVAKVVGKLNFSVLTERATQVHVAGAASPGSASSTVSASPMQAATAISPVKESVGSANQVSPSATTAAVSVNPPSISVAAAGGRSRRERKEDLAQAYAMNKSISDDLLRKLKENK